MLDFLLKSPEVLFIALILLVAAVGAWFVMNKPIKQAIENLHKLNESLSKANSFDDTELDHIKLEIKDNNIKYLFEETQNGFFDIPTDFGNEKFSLKPYQEIWQPKDILAKKLNINLYEAMPNLLIGAGLMFTFIFLAVALGSASNALTATGAEAVKPLLETAGGKFITSIVGLFCSLLWNYGSKISLEKLDNQIEALCVTLRKVAKESGAENAVQLQITLLNELIIENREQVGQLKRFETDFAVAIANAMGSALAPSFEGLGTELKSAIDNLSDNISKMQQDALAEMMQEFIHQMNLTQNAEMQNFLQALSGLALQLENAVPSMAAAADAASKRITDNLTTAVEMLTSGFGNCMDDLNEASKSLENALLNVKGNVVDLSETIERARELGDIGVQKAELVIDKLSTSVQGLETGISGMANVVTAIHSTTGSLSNLHDNLNESVDAQRSVVRTVQEVIPRLYQDIQTAFLEINNASKSSEKAMLDAKNYLTNTTDRLDNTLSNLNEGIDNYSTRIRELHNQLDNHLGNAINQLNATIEHLSETLEEYTESLPTNMVR